jgi:hypothetical protein
VRELDRGRGGEREKGRSGEGETIVSSPSLVVSSSPLVPFSFGPGKGRVAGSLVQVGVGSDGLTQSAHQRVVRLRKRPQLGLTPLARIEVLGQSVRRRVGKTPHQIIEQVLSIGTELNRHGVAPGEKIAAIGPL